jgi:hypothetical protein
MTSLAADPHGAAVHPALHRTSELGQEGDFRATPTFAFMSPRQRAKRSAATLAGNHPPKATKVPARSRSFWIPKSSIRRQARPPWYQGVLFSIFLSVEEVDFPVDGGCLVVLGWGVGLVAALSVGVCVFLVGTLGAVAGGLAAPDGSFGGSVGFGGAASGVGSALGSAFGPAVGPGSAGCALLLSTPSTGFGVAPASPSSTGGTSFGVSPAGARTFGAADFDSASDDSGADDSGAGGSGNGESDP